MIVYILMFGRRWRPSKKIRKISAERAAALWHKYRVSIKGRMLMPMIEEWKDMRLPKSVIHALKHEGYRRPKAVQMQCIPLMLLMSLSLDFQVGIYCASRPMAVEETSHYR